MPWHRAGRRTLTQPPDLPARRAGVVAAGRDTARPRRVTPHRPHRGGTVTYRVIQWATGNVGRAAIEGVLGHPDLELAGCWVHSEAKDGTDVGTLIGRDRLGVTATTDVDALLGLDADCVVYSPIFADERVITRILESGKNVVTPLGWFYPPAEDRSPLHPVRRAA